MYEDIPEWMFWGAIGYTLAKALRETDELGERIAEAKRDIDRVDRDLQQLKRDLDAYERAHTKKGFWGWLLW